LGAIVAKTRSQKQILADVKRLAVEYYAATGRPLGATGEIAEYEAAEKLGLTLAAARNTGYDATKQIGDRTIRIQIKGRRPPRDELRRGRVPGIDLRGKFDCVMLVLLSPAYEALEIWQASRIAVRRRLEIPGSRARNEDGAMSISQFVAIATQVWPDPVPPRAARAKRPLSPHRKAR
jgi:hypothetical protein